MKISTIIPVYNKGDYTKRAVESAINLDEVAEVILIEDGSNDNSLEVCKKLSDEFENVHLYTHPENKNLGIANSRNLGIRKAKCDYISFLDADDWYLKNRFKDTKKVFMENPDADGVYDAVGTAFEDEKAAEKWKDFEGEKILSAPKKKVAPEDFLYEIITNWIGTFHTNGIVLKKKVFDKVGYFEKEFEPSEDMHMWIRLISVCKLYPACIDEARAMRYIYRGNTYTKDKKKLFEIRKLYWRKLFDWSISNNLSIKNKSLILLPHLIYKSDLQKDKVTLKNLLKFQINILISLIKHPIITSVTIFWIIKKMLSLRK